MPGSETTTPETPRPTLSYAALACFCAATVTLLPLGLEVLGAGFWVAAAVLAGLSGQRVLRRNLWILLAALAVLAVSPIHTDLSPRHFLTLGLPFLLVVVGPYLYLKWRAPGEVEWRFWPRRWSGRDIFYVLISIPLSWFLIEMYFFHWTPDVASHWPIPAEYDRGVAQRLVLGINCVGVWDELFFINTVYVLLRSCYSATVANLGQAVVYTSVLYTMAFTGAGPFLIFPFALTQGWMYEKSGVLLYVLIVHLIVDVFLVLAILGYHYPDGYPLVF